ncbi:hypothetical protein F1880_002744 [Penicillium rolfsii]|nr:hypothetical protein F1880_002744 [Penicillium rolfsii]
MLLKRGLERASCDFCFRRKIKCDRSSRAREGHDSCSQCDLRQKPCTLDSDDVRINRRRRVDRGSGDLKGGSTVSTIAEPSFNDRGTVTPPLGDDTSLLLSPQTSMAATFTPDANYDSPLYASSSESLWTDLDLQLSSESLSFLDEVFMQGFAPSEPVANVDDHSSTYPQNSNVIMGESIANQPPYEIQGIDSGTLEAALAAYFDFASLVLPIIHRDAFMTDYQSHQSSSALVFAVACRGCPFLSVPDKWKLQQEFAAGFRSAFLEARNDSASTQTIRLDDLEALALMVDFPYGTDGNTATALHSHLGALFLTHESLVLITLQSQILSPPALQRTAERKSLLLWHVYGLDAFYCLDHGIMSRIQEEDIEGVNPSESSTGHETRSYLDTMLSLASIVRRITRKICSPGAKRKGVKSHEVEDLYEQLSKWGQDSCPSRLRVTGNLSSDLTDRKGSGQSSNTSSTTLLHSTVITLLELNCYMEIERCLSIGIQDRASAEGEALELRIGYETLKAANKIYQTITYVGSCGQILTGHNQYSLIDLSPGILRNMCAGASNWFCNHAQNLLHQQSLLGAENSAHAQHHKTLSIQRAEDYLRKATKLRDTAAKAVSHMDTAQVVSRVNEQLEALKMLIEQS